MELGERELEALHQTIYSLERLWAGPIPDGSVWHPYDPLPLAEFMSGIHTATEALNGGRRFLDVGCGVGTKLVLMHYLGWKVAGIDRHGPYVEAARQLCDEAEITHADLRDVDSFDADLVFMYRPAVAEELECEVEEHVVEAMNDGAVLFLPLRDVERLGLHPVAPHVGVK